MSSKMLMFDFSYKNGEIRAYHPGCGCCGGWPLLEVKELEEQITLLEEALEQARSALATYRQNA
jgi:hypothetical protein